MFARQWRYRGRCDSIQFCVDKRIFIVGFGLYGSSNGAADYSVRIELKRLGRVLAGNNKKFFSDGSSNTFQVHFEQPVQVCVTPCSLFFFWFCLCGRVDPSSSFFQPTRQIEPETFYTASAILDGSELSYFGQEV